MKSTIEADRFKDKMQGVELCVRHIMALFPETRSNDKLLMLHYWELVDHIKIPREFWRDFMKKATTPETITRARRRIQQEGNYQPREEVKRIRQARSKKFREIFSGQKTLM